MTYTSRYKNMTCWKCKLQCTETFSHLKVIVYCCRFGFNHFPVSTLYWKWYFDLCHCVVLQTISVNDFKFDDWNVSFISINEQLSVFHFFSFIQKQNRDSNYRSWYKQGITQKRNRLITFSVIFFRFFLETKISS